MFDFPLFVMLSFPTLLIVIERHVVSTSYKGKRTMKHPLDVVVSTSWKGKGTMRLMLS